MADAGSGTGICTELLLKSGAAVSAIKRNPEIRHAAERLLSGQSGFCSVAGSAQATTLAGHSVDLIVAARAFHWFNEPATRTKFKCIQKPGGHPALIWNERRIDTTPFLRAYEKLLTQHAGDYATLRHKNTGLESLTNFFTRPFLTHVFFNEQQFDYGSLEGRLLSSSCSPAEGQPGHHPMIANLRRIFEAWQEDGLVEMQSETKVHLGR